MILLFGTWIGLWVVCLGLGAATFGLAFRVGGPAFRVAPSMSQVMWLGVSLLLCALQIASLLGPLGPKTLVGIGLISLGGLYRVRPLVRAFVAGARQRGLAVVAIQLLVVLVVLAFVANSALQPTTYRDTISTHIQQVKWAATYGTPLGLGNLNPKFGFDQAHHLLAAALDFGPFSHRTCHTALPFLGATLAIDWTVTLTTPTRKPFDLVVRAFVALTVPFVAGKLWSDELASLSGDLAMGCLLLPALRELLRVGRARRAGWTLLVLGALAGALFGVKFSAMPVTVTAVGLLAYLALRRRLSIRALVIASSPLVLLLVSTCLRRVFITGWILFPIPYGNLHLPWSVTREQTLDQYLWIKSWARMPGVKPSDVLDHGFFHWFVPWFDRFRGTRELVVCCFGFAALVARALSPERDTPLFRATTLALVVAVAGVVYWFVGAPDPRFGAAFMWAIPALALAPSIARARDATLLVGFVVAMTWWNEGVAMKVREGETLLRDQDAPTKIVTFHNADGAPFSVVVPTHDDLCGDAPLPCSPWFSTQKMKEPGNLARGFRP